VGRQAGGVDGLSGYTQHLGFFEYRCADNTQWQNGTQIFNDLFTAFLTAGQQSKTQKSAFLTSMFQIQTTVKPIFSISLDF
jgi:hypothetical protein